MINVSDQHAPRSLIVTLYGAYGRFMPGPVPVAELIRLLAAVGVDAPSVRSSVSRLKRRGLLLPARTAQGAAGYELSPGRPPVARRRRPPHLRHGPARGRGLGARRVLRAGVRAAEAARAALPPGRARLRHRGPRRLDRPRTAVRGDPAHARSGCASTRTSTSSAASTSASRRPRRRSPAGGTWRPSPRSTRRSSTATRACCATGSARDGHPAGGGLPRLPPRPGLLAPPALRRPRACPPGCSRRTGRASRSAAVFRGLHERLRDAGAAFVGL